MSRPGDLVARAQRGDLRGLDDWAAVRGLDGRARGRQEGQGPSRRTGSGEGGVGCERGRRKSRAAWAPNARSRPPSRPQALAARGCLGLRGVVLLSLSPHLSPH